MKVRNPKAFTLIELLVVVLIIGILSAIALPQYEKAVEKSRMAEALTNMSSLQKAADIYILEHGDCEGELLGDDGAANLLDVDLETGLDCTAGGGDKCASKNFGYDVYGGSEDCHVRALRTKSANNEHGDMFDYYELELRKDDSLNNPWTRHCYIYKNSKEGNMTCNQLYKDGWED